MFNKSKKEKSTYGIIGLGRSASRSPSSWAWQAPT